MITIYFDGSCQPINPGGIASYGYAIYQDGNSIKKGCRVIGEGPDMTNNVAEFFALKRALEWLSEHIIEEKVVVKGDSQLVINQMKGDWKIKSKTSKEFVPLIKHLAKDLDIEYIWIPREENSEADMLATVAYKRYKV